MGRTAVRGARRVDGDDNNDFAESYSAALGGLVAYFRTKGVPAEDARDLAHETLVRTLVHLKRHGRTRDNLGPLTKTIARNLLVERLRKATLSMVPLTDAVELVDDAPEPADLALATERREAVRLALSSLTPRHRRVVELWMEGRSPAEIARELGIKRNAADAILHRARRALAPKLGPRALWGLVALAWLRARTTVRDGAQTIASFSPSSASAVPAGISLATVGLAAVLSATSPATPATASTPATAVTHAAPKKMATEIASPRKVTRPPVAAAAVADGASAKVVEPRPPRYALTAGTKVKNPATGEDEERGLDIWYDPNANGRGPLDDTVFEPLLKQTCATCGRDG